jgi:hypothetical protein
MTKQAEATSVRAQVVVDAPIDEAFQVFTAGIGRWWPPEYNLLAVEIAERMFEPRVGGHIYDCGVDGLIIIGAHCSVRDAAGSWERAMALLTC